MNEILVVLSILDYETHRKEGERAGIRPGNSKFWLVKVGLEVIGAVYQPDPDRPGTPKWAWEGAGEGTSFDHGLTYATKMAAAFGLAAQWETDMREEGIDPHHACTTARN